jgi:hypothetical protein
MLDDFINISKDEKSIMHMWNSFVSRQRLGPSLKFPFNFWLSWEIEVISVPAVSVLAQIVFTTMVCLRMS